MKQYVCSICTYTYDEAKGIPEAGIAPGTKWEDLPADWKCPWCGAGKDAFHEKKEEATSVPAERGALHVDAEMSAMEMSVICSNLARGCEKQYMPEQEAAFKKLAEFFRAGAEPVPEANMKHLLQLINQDLDVGYAQANETAQESQDRGALRSLTWGEKVTRMLSSLLTRYEVEGDRMLKYTGVYICTICGFIYIGDAAPELCPVCKVPSWKFEKVEGRAQ